MIGPITCHCPPHQNLKTETIGSNIIQLADAVGPSRQSWSQNLANFKSGGRKKITGVIKCYLAWGQPIFFSQNVWLPTAVDISLELKSAVAWPYMCECFSERNSLLLAASCGFSLNNRGLCAAGHWSEAVNDQCGFLLPWFLRFNGIIVPWWRYASRGCGISCFHETRRVVWHVRSGFLGKVFSLCEGEGRNAKVCSRPTFVMFRPCIGTVQIECQM